jgi:hypothetical protein
LSRVKLAQFPTQNRISSVKKKNKQTTYVTSGNPANSSSRKHKQTNKEKHHHPFFVARCKPTPSSNTTIATLDSQPFGTPRLHKGDGRDGRRCSSASPIVLGPSARTQQCVQGRPFVHCQPTWPNAGEGCTPDARNHVCAGRHGDGPLHHVGGALAHTCAEFPGPGARDFERKSVKIHLGDGVFRYRSGVDGAPRVL